MDIEKLIKEKGYKGAIIHLIDRINETKRAESELRRQADSLYKEGSCMHENVSSVIDYIKEHDDGERSLVQLGPHGDLVRFVHDSVLVTVERNKFQSPTSPRLRITIKEENLLE
ncbi:MAG: hypothetical protein LBS05_09445 [Tannerellaceae bacterium]|jgi:predicted ribosome quality control (RQC) complex YloA/Tae2 family protein|nr:hypothetical protein [Tannerellaceae bacterium]